MASATGIPAATYARRRKQLMRMAGNDAILVLPAAAERIRSRDTHYPYRQDSDLSYLTGFPEPEAVLVLVPGRKHGETLLFCRERHPEREGWDGPRFGPEGAVDSFGLDDAYPITDIDDILPGLIEGRDRVYSAMGSNPEFDRHLMDWINVIRSKAHLGAQPPNEFVALDHLLHDMRLYKSAAEVKVMREAARISAQAHVRAMQASRVEGPAKDADFYITDGRGEVRIKGYRPGVGATSQYPRFTAKASRRPCTGMVRPGSSVRLATMPTTSSRTRA